MRQSCSFSSFFMIDKRKGKKRKYFVKFDFHVVFHVALQREQSSFECRIIKFDFEKNAAVLFRRNAVIRNFTKLQTIQAALNSKIILTACSFCCSKRTHYFLMPEQLFSP